MSGPQTFRNASDPSSVPAVTVEQVGSYFGLPVIEATLFEEPVHCLDCGEGVDSMIVHGIGSSIQDPEGNRIIHTANMDGGILKLTAGGALDPATHIVLRTSRNPAAWHELLGQQVSPHIAQSLAKLTGADTPPDTAVDRTLEH